MGRRHKDADWKVPDSPADWTQVNASLLMDLRDQMKTQNALLKELNDTLGCFRVRRMCDDINRIEKRLQKVVSLRARIVA